MADARGVERPRLAPTDAFPNRRIVSRAAAATLSETAAGAAAASGCLVLPFGRPPPWWRALPDTAAVNAVPWPLPAGARGGEAAAGRLECLSAWLLRAAPALRAAADVAPPAQWRETNNIVAVVSAYPSFASLDASP